MTTPLPHHQNAINLLQLATGIVHDENTAASLIIELADNLKREQLTIRAEREHDTLLSFAHRYIAGESARSLTAAMGYKDHTHAASRLRPAVEELGGVWRGQSESWTEKRRVSRANGKGEGMRPGELSKGEALELSGSLLRSAKQ